MASIDEALAVAEANAPICIIDPDTRVISVPSEYKNFGVESDEKVTRVHFQCPKIVGDNIDLTEFNLYINYRNANGELNMYLIDDMSNSGDNVVFSWLLSRHVTAYTGNVDYIVCAKKSDGSSITNEWNTKIATGTVSGGLEATKEIEEQNADVIEQILKRLDNDYITQSELQAATDKALAQAKASGEFDGATGPAGPRGEKGDTGPQGPAGADGAQGPAGANGKDGVSVTHSWAGTVLNVTSASGTSSADLKGDKGDKGDTGPAGEKGDKGDTGAQGPKGDTGPQGLKGDTGPRGPQGEQGPQGDTGPKGDTGPAGPAGQSAYAAAKAGGYTGTQTNFYADLAAMQGLASALAAI